MAFSLEELAEATAPVTLPEDAAELSKARGDTPAAVEDDDAVAPPAKPAAKPLTEAEKADAEAAVEGLGKKEEPAAKEEDEPARGPDGKFIPKGRFDELRIAKDKKIAAAEARASTAEEALRIREGPASVKEAEALIDTKTDTYQQLLADGKLKEAKVLFQEINVLNRQIAKLEMTPTLSAATAGSIDASSLEDVVDMYLTEFPEFGDQKSNQALIDEVNELSAGYEALVTDKGARKYSPAAALRKAADLVIKSHGLQPLSERDAPKKEAKPEDKGAQRKKDALTANVDASKRQPAQLDNVGVDSDKHGAANINVASLSEKDFADLPESTLKRLRGDHFAG